MTRRIIKTIPRSVKNAAGLVVCCAGSGVIAFGVWEIYRPAGIIAGGVALVAIGWLLDSLGGE